MKHKEAASSTTDADRVLCTALLRAGAELGLSQAAVGRVVGKNRSTLARGRLNPQSKEGELALLLIRIYRALFALVDGDAPQMRHWMHTANRHLDGVPAELVEQVSGLVMVLRYLDALRGRN